MCALVTAFVAVNANGEIAATFGPESTLIIRALTQRKWRSLGGIARDSGLSHKAVREFLRDHSNWFDTSSIRVGGECLYALSEKGYRAITALGNVSKENISQKLSTSKVEPLGDTERDYGQSGKSDSEKAREPDNIANPAAEYGRVTERKTKVTEASPDSPEDQVKKTVLRNARLGGENLRGIVLSARDLSSIDLSRANLQGASLDRAVLVNANLSGSDMLGANLNGADLCGADLQDTVLFAANLNGADFRGANLAGADLRRASLIGARNLTSNQLANTILDNSTILPDYIRDVHESNKSSTTTEEENDGEVET